MQIKIKKEMEFSFVPMAIVAILLAAMAHTPLATHESDSSIKEFLAAHNAARAAVGVPPVTWNATLAAYAEAYAAERSADCAPQHSQGPYGENIAEASAEISAAASVKLWLDEKPHFDQASNACVGGQCLHYTQMVWRHTKSIGCARATCKNNGWMFVTCNYYPPGNYVGEHPF